MEQVSLSVEPRETTGKGPSRRLRMKGKIPGILYGPGESIKVILDPKTLTKFLLEEGGKNRLFTMQGAELDGKCTIIRDYQVDPITRKLMHVDFQEIDVTKKITVVVPLNFTGKAHGVVEGGILNVVERDIEVECLPTEIPSHIDVDVTGLDIGDSVHLKELEVPEGIEKIIVQNLALVTVVPPAKEEELAPALATGLEPEVIGEKKEGEEEGAPAAEGKEAAPEDKESK